VAITCNYASGWKNDELLFAPDYHKGNFVMRVEPLGDRIVVKRLEAEAQTAGGIVLPDSAQEKPQSGKILAVGAGKVLDNGSRAKMQVSEGDRVLFSSYAGTEIEVDGVDLLIMSESDVLAVMD
jgi:chaperonin GroES